MTDREPIKLTDTMKETIIKMCEGNPGGLRVLMEVYSKDPIHILTLDDMNIRGWQIWVGYKDYCNCDLDLFIAKLKERSVDMVNIINQEAIRAKDPVRAVTSGASRPKGVY